MQVDKFNIDELNNSSQQLKKTISNTLGIKADVTDETVAMKLNGIDENGNAKLEMKMPKMGFGNLFNTFSENWKELSIGLIYWLFVFANFIKFYGFGSAIKTLDLAYTEFNNIFLEVVIVVAPLVIWAMSTNYQRYNFRNKKRTMFHIAYWLINFIVIRVTFVISYSIFVPFISRIEPSAAMSAGKIIGLAYISTFVPMAIILALLLSVASRSTSLNRDFMRQIDEYRLFKVYDPHVYSKYEYTYSVVKDMTTGENITIPQKDRQMHTAIIGATGTAKTSSVLLPGILSDVKVRIRNKTALKKAFKYYAEKGILRIKQPFEDVDFTTNLFEPNPDYAMTFLDKISGRTPKRIYEHLLNKYEIAGQTILVPEDSLADDAYELFTAYGEKVNRVDPKKIDGKHKPGFKGMNILYISPTMPDWAVERERVRRATLLADVMQIMFEMGGKSDPYFASVNRIATTTIALLLQLTYPQMYGRQPNLVDVQNCLNDFTKLTEPYMQLFPQGRVTDKNVKYQWLKDNVTNFFLGEGSTTFEQHARGLKVQFSLFLADDYIRELLTADDVIDFDAILSNNELTVVNIELPEVGPINSPALGLFFTVNMTNAVLRRPGTEFTRTFHVWRIDEFPIVVTPSMEQAFTLFRKFKVAMEVALQTLDQMKKTPYLKYLEGVILNSTANQIVFGRANISEQEIYSGLSGTIRDVIDMEGTSETSIFTESPSISVTKRQTSSLANVNEMSDIRFKDFQEVTYFYTKRGSLMPTVHGKVNFISKNDKKGPSKIVRYDWKKLYAKHSEDKIDTVKVLQFTEEQLKSATNKEVAVSQVDLIKNEAPSIKSQIDFSILEEQQKTIDIEQENTKIKPAAAPKQNMPLLNFAEIEIEENPISKAAPIDSKEAKEKHNKNNFDFF